MKAVKIIILIFLALFLSCKTEEAPHSPDILIPPENPTNFKTEAGNEMVTLSWDNITSDFAKVVIYRSQGSYPQEPGQGVLIYSGINGACSDTGLTGGTSYYYTLFTIGDNGLHSSGVNQNSKPYEVFKISNFTLTQEVIGGIKLEWADPDDIDYVGVKILRRDENIPSNPDPSSPGATYTTVYQGTGNDILVGNISTLSDTISLLGDVTYYYYAFSYDKNTKYSNTSATLSIYSCARLGTTLKLGTNKLCP